MVPSLIYLRKNKMNAFVNQYPFFQESINLWSANFYFNRLGAKWEQ